ncbi:MAG TPA: GTPase Era, partial [Mycobacteriales bacterium]|nr:GTPase Era [Mycobacteriales bacterium]
MTEDSPFRCGFVAFVGRPNAGKSTLLNALVGTKVAITSGKPQTTRRAVRGIVHRPEGQLVVVDTPGLHRPRTLLGQRTNAVAHDALSDVDVVALCIPADERIGPGDRFIAEQLAALERSPTLVAVVTKTDTVPSARVAEQLLAASELLDFAEIVPTSAVEGHQVDLLAELLIALMPEGPALYGDDERTDTPLDVQVAELVREAALEGVRDELPHSLAAEVEEMLPREGKDLLDVRVTLYVERPTQRAIVVGR